MDPPIPSPISPPFEGANQTALGNSTSSPFNLWAQRDFILLEAKLVFSALGCIYIGAHAALRRPPSAAPAKSKTGKKLRKSDDDQFTQGLLPSDAIVFPLMAGFILVGLYYLIQWMKDPAIINKILRVYMSTMSVASLTTLLAHVIQLAASFVFPSYWIYHGYDNNTSRIYYVDPVKERYRLWSSERGTSDIIEPRTSPLPGNLAWLGGAIGSPRFNNFLWELRHLLTEEWTVRLKVHGILQEKMKLKFSYALGLVFSLASITTYYMTESKMLSNLMGYGFCYGSFLIMSPTTFVTGSMLLIGLFFYDIIMVFYTPYMITVATKLDVPIKLTFESAAKSSILGLGDIVVPGIVMCLALRFDLWRHYQQQIQYVPTELRSETKNATSGEVVANSEMHRRTKKAEYINVKGNWGDRFWTSTWLGLLSKPDESMPSSVRAAAFPKTYFHASLVGYTIGMLVTLTMLVVFKHGQPALLYLVPGVLGSLWLTGLVRGELKEMWIYTEDGSLDTRDVVVEVDGNGNVIKEFKKAKKADGKGDSGKEAKKEAKEIDMATAGESNGEKLLVKSHTGKGVSEEEVKTTTKAKESEEFAKANRSYDVFHFSVTAPARHGFIEEKKVDDEDDDDDEDEDEDDDEDDIYTEG